MQANIVPGPDDARVAARQARRRGLCSWCTCCCSRWGMYALVSNLVAIGTIQHAAEMRESFYSTVLFLSSSKTALAVRDSLVYEGLQ